MKKEKNTVFTSEQIEEKLNTELVGWSYDGKWIRKTFKTHSWKSTMMVTNTIGHIAEIGWHHPDLQVSYAFVEVKLMTHSEKGITNLDFALAKKIDEVIYWDPKKDDSNLEGTPEDPRFAYIKK